MKFGYARVSTQDQSLTLQLDALKHYDVDQIFEEKESGKKKNRHQLDELLKILRKGDTVVVYKLDRISRSTKHLIELMEQFDSSLTPYHYLWITKCDEHESYPLFCGHP